MRRGRAGSARTTGACGSPGRRRAGGLHRRPAVLPRRLGRPARRGRAGALPPQLAEDRVEPPALDELHGVEMRPPVLADAEDRHDVGVVQPRRRAGLALEPADLPRVGQGPGRQDLQGDAAAERLLLGLVDDPHPAPAELAQQAELAQPARRGPGDLARAGVDRSGALAVVAAGIPWRQQGGEAGEDLVGQVGIAPGILRGRRRLAPPHAVQEFLGEGRGRVGAAADGRCRHARRHLPDGIAPRPGSAAGRIRPEHRPARHLPCPGVC